MQNVLNITTGTLIADGAVLAVIAIFAIKSWRKGFVNCFFSFISGFAALILAFVLAAPMLNLTGGWFGIQDAITEPIVQSFAKRAAFNIDVSSVSLELALADKTLPAFIKNAIIDAGVDGVPQGTTLAMIAGQKIGAFTATLVSFAIVFVILKIGVKIVQRLVGSILPTLPVLGKVDGFLGLALGLIEGFVLVSCVIAVFAVLPFGSTGQFFQESIFLKWLYNKNLLHTIFSWFLK